MTTNELVDLGLGSGVHVLELVHSLELDDVETIGKDAVRFSLEEMLGFIGGDVRDSGEDVSAVCGGTLNAVSVIDSALARFVINVEILEIVVEIDGACAQIAT